MAEAGELGEALTALEERLGSTAAMVAAFDGELARMRETALYTGREVNALSSGLGGGLRRAFDGLIFDGASLSDALKGVAKSMADTIYSVAMKPVSSAAGGLLAEGVNSVMSAFLPLSLIHI